MIKPCSEKELDEMMGIVLTCDYCGKKTLSVDKRRLNTSYENDEQNFVTSCYECFCEMYKEYEDMWKEYYSGLGYTKTEIKPPTYFNNLHI